MTLVLALPPLALHLPLPFVGFDTPLPQWEGGAGSGTYTGRCRLYCCILLNNSFNISFSWSSARYCTRVSCIKNFTWVHTHNLYFYRQYRVLNALLISIPGVAWISVYTMELAWLTGWACRGNRWAKLMPRWLAVPRRLDRSSFCIRSTPLLGYPPLRSVFIFKKLTHQNDELSVLWEMLHTKMMNHGFQKEKKTKMMTH